MSSSESQPGNDTAELRQLRAARKQALFREVNERLEELNRRLSDVVPISDLFCECVDDGCTQRIGISLSEYEQVRANPTYFAVRHGHVYPDTERVVAEREGYAVVEKIGAAAAYAALLAERARAAAAPQPHRAAL